MLGNVAGARQVYQRWMQWEPDHHGWAAYIKMEMRYGEVERAQLDEIKLWHQTLRAYRAQQWDQVEVSLLNLQRMHPGRELDALYAERVTQFRRSPPPAGWDGVTSFDEK